MRRLTHVLMVGVVATALLVEGIGSIGTAQAAGEPVPPKDWEGTITFSVSGFSSAQVFFERNGCDWAGLEEQLNGFDALIWDVEDYSSFPASYSWTASQDFGQVVTMFVTPECVRMGGVAGGIADEPNKKVDFLIPPLAKWVAFIPIAPGSATDIGISMHSDGTPDEEPKPKRKKKKKRGRK